MDKKTIVIFIGGYLPGQNYGGPVTSLENFSDQLCDIYNIKIICSDHDFKDPVRYYGIADGWNKVGNAEVFYINERDYNSEAFHDIIKSFEKTIAFFYLSGVYYIKMNYAVIRMARKCHIPVLLAPRGDLMRDSIAMKSKLKMLKKVVFLAVCRITGLFKGVYFQSTSDEETEGLHNYLHIKDKQIYQLPNMPVMRRERAGYQKQKNELKVLFISRFMIKKNPAFALEAVGNIEEKYRVTFDLYGPIEDKAYWSICDSLIREINSTKKNITAVYKGSLKPKDAKRIYDGYDCFIFPTLSENYGHVIVESISSGCPVILSKGTTPFDDCHGRGSYVVSLKDKQKFTCYLEEIASMNQVEYQELVDKTSEYVDEKFQVEGLKKDYLDMISDIVEAKR